MGRPFTAAANGGMILMSPTACPIDKSFFSVCFNEILRYNLKRLFILYSFYSNNTARLQEIGRKSGKSFGTSLLQQNEHLAAEMQDDLGKIKMLGKKGWIQLFGKSVDNLKTNHKVHFSCQLLGPVRLA